MSLSFCAKPKRKCGAGLVLIALVPADGDHRVVGSGCGGNNEEVSAQEPGCALHSNAAWPNHVFPPASPVSIIANHISDSNSLVELCSEGNLGRCVNIQHEVSNSMFEVEICRMIGSLKNKSLSLAESVLKLLSHQLLNDGVGKAVVVPRSLEVQSQRKSSLSNASPKLVLKAQDLRTSSMRKLS